MTLEEKKPDDDWASTQPARPDDPWASSVPEPVTAADDEWGASTPYSQNAVPPLIIEQHGGTFNPTVVKFLVYGESGVGKSRFASTWPNVIFADADKGMSSVTEKVDRVSIDTFQQAKDLLLFLQNGDHEYETVVLDTLNELQRLAMNATVEDFPLIKRSYRNLPSMSDYGKMLHEFMELCFQYILLPLRVVLVAQSNTRQFDTDVVMPDLVGKKTSRNLARKMDVIGFLYTSSTEEDGRPIPEMNFGSAQYVCKDRSFKLPAALQLPTFERMSAYWK